MAGFSTTLMIGMVLAMEIPFNSSGEDCSAWLAAEKEKNSVKIEAYCRCREQSDILYRLTTVSSGSSGTSRSSQLSKKVMAADTPVRLAEIRLEKVPPLSYVVELEVYRNGVLAAQTRVESGLD